MICFFCYDVVMIVVCIFVFEKFNNDCIFYVYVSCVLYLEINLYLGCVLI